MVKEYPGFGRHIEEKSTEVCHPFQYERGARKVDKKCERGEL
jgi:hypothetical protein